MKLGALADQFIGQGYGRQEEPVVLKDFPLSDAHHKYARFLSKNMGFENIILRGSSLYLPYLEILHGEQMPEPSDMDALANFGDFEAYRHSDRRPDAVGYYCEARMLWNLHIDLLPTSSHKNYRISFEKFGKTCELILTNEPLDIRREIMCRNEAPIAAVFAVLDSGPSGGKTLRVMAHPLFEEHAKERLYRPAPGIWPDVLKKRLDKWRRVPGITTDLAHHPFYEDRRPGGRVSGFTERTL